MYKLSNERNHVVLELQRLALLCLQMKKFPPFTAECLDCRKHVTHLLPLQCSPTSCQCCIEDWNVGTKVCRQSSYDLKGFFPQVLLGQFGDAQRSFLPGEGPSSTYPFPKETNTPSISCWQNNSEAIRPEVPQFNMVNLYPCYRIERKHARLQTNTLRFHHYPHGNKYFLTKDKNKHSKVLENLFGRRHRRFCPVRGHSLSPRHAPARHMISHHRESVESAARI